MPDADAGACSDEESDDEPADFFSAWAEKWEQEFSRFNAAETDRLSREANMVAQCAKVQDPGAYRQVFQSAMHEADARARQNAAYSSEVEAARRANEFAKMSERAESSRQSIAKAAIDESGEIMRQLAERAAQQKRASEAKLLAARQRRRAEAEAAAQRRKEQRAAANAECHMRPPRQPSAEPHGRQPNGSEPQSDRRQYSKDGGTSDSGGAAGSRASTPRQPRFTREPGAHAAHAAKEAKKAPLDTFPAFQAAWLEFEQRLSVAGTFVGVADVPWPVTPAAALGIGAFDAPKDQKRKLRAAVLRWHPDKWGPILEKTREAERKDVMERVKEVTRMILQEKKRLGF